MSKTSNRPSCGRLNRVSGGEAGVAFLNHGIHGSARKALIRFSNTPRDRFEVFAIVSDRPLGDIEKLVGENCSNRSHCGGEWFRFRNSEGLFLQPLPCRPNGRFRAFRGFTDGKGRGWPKNRETPEHQGDFR